MAASIAGSAVVAFKSTGITSRLSGEPKLRRFGTSVQLHKQQSFSSECRFTSSFASSGEINLSQLFTVIFYSRNAVISCGGYVCV